MDNYVGEIRSFAGERIPEGWHLCDGSELMIRDHMVLFALIGFIYGGNEASGRFRLPDLRSRIPLGVGGNYSLGKPGGAEKVRLNTEHFFPITVTRIWVNLQVGSGHSASRRRKGYG